MVNLHRKSEDTPTPRCGDRCVTPRWVEKGESIRYRASRWPFARGCDANWLGHAAGAAPQPRRPMVAWHVADNVSRHGGSLAPGKCRHYGKWESRGNRLVPPMGRKSPRRFGGWDRKVNENRLCVPKSAAPGCDAMCRRRSGRPTCFRACRNTPRRVAEPTARHDAARWHTHPGHACRSR